MSPLTEQTLEQELKALQEKSYYEIIGVADSAGAAEIQTAFHEFSRRFHPDAHRGQSESFRDKARAIFERGAEAYGVLRVPRRRSDYDLTLARGRVRLDAPEGEAVRPSAQKSLEDLCQTKGAQLLARQATRAISEGKVREARDLTRRALWAEGKNPELAERLQALEELVKMGAG